MLPSKSPLTLMTRGVPAEGRGSLKVMLVSVSSSAAVRLRTFVTPPVRDTWAWVAEVTGRSSGTPFADVSVTFSAHCPISVDRARY